LVPSVPRMFSYYHSDADKVLASPQARVVIDDGRRYLERTQEQYDLITIDPPPPLEAAASSLLYSKEFYRAAKRRLRPGGILQQWLPTSPESNPVVVTAVARSLQDSFPYIRAFFDDFGIHFLCSDRPLPRRTAGELLQRMPERAIDDLAEWGEADEPAKAAKDQLDTLLKQELPMEKLLEASPDTPALTDDRPINEYYAWREWRQKGKSLTLDRDSD
jgi:spermidine synthase